MIFSIIKKHFQQPPSADESQMKELLNSLDFPFTEEEVDNTIIILKSNESQDRWISKGMIQGIMQNIAHCGKMASQRIGINHVLNNGWTL